MLVVLLTSSLLKKDKKFFPFLSHYKGEFATSLKSLALAELHFEGGTLTGLQEDARCLFMAGAEEMLITFGRRQNVNGNVPDVSLS